MQQHCPSMWAIFLLLTVTVALSQETPALHARIVPGVSSDDDDDNADKFVKLVTWVRQNGGRVDNRLGLSNHQHGYKGRSVRGGTALHPMIAGTELLFLPWNIVLGTVGDTSAVPEDTCEVLRSYAAEVDAGAGSFWGPYLALDDSLSGVGRVPSLWGQVAIDELQGLPPFGSTAGLTGWFCSNCVDANEDGSAVIFSDLPESVRQSLLAAITRAAGMRFLPIYDLLNHHNGLLNVKSNADKKGITITVTRDIAEGEEIFMSYRGGTDSTTSEIYRRYGFVESWPQHWAWTDQGGHGEDVDAIEMHFLLLPGNSVTIDPPDSMTSQFGQTTPTIEEMIASAEKHNQGLSTERLVQFGRAGLDLISSLPTTKEEDLLVLSNMELSLSLHMKSGGSGEEMMQMRDQISAVEYRINFKEAIQTALVVVKDILSTRSNRREL